MKRAGIVGWPVSHSLSPVLHGYWLKEHGIAGEFLRLPAEPQDFADVIAKARADGFTGVNVTVPHKEAAFALATNASPMAHAAGAANLLTFRSDAVHADNTDAYGLTQSLIAAGPFTDKTAVLLGAGGAARGAVLALNDLGLRKIHILNRSADKAAALTAALQDFVTATLAAGTLDDWANAASDAALVVNATSAGMKGAPSLTLDISQLPTSTVVCDIVYNPLETPLLKDAAARGHQTIDGLGMLMHQAVPSFEAFFGIRPQVTPGLRAALIAALHA